MYLKQLARRGQFVAGFENGFGGGDGDFDDIMFSVSNVGTTDPTAVPDPASPCCWVRVWGSSRDAVPSRVGHVPAAAFENQASIAALIPTDRGYDCSRARLHPLAGVLSTVQVATRVSRIGPALEHTCDITASS